MTKGSTFPDSNPKLKKQLLKWEREAPKPVKEAMEELSASESIEPAPPKRAVVERLTGIGAKAKGAIRVLVNLWLWSPRRKRPIDRLKATRQAREMKRLTHSIGKALLNMGGVAVEPLAAALKSRSPRLREKATVLAEMTDSRAVTPLLSALGDESPLVRRCSAEALGLIGSERAVRPLFEALGDRNSEVRVAAGRSLTAIGTPRAIKKLIDGLKSDRATVRDAAEALGSLRAPRDPLAVDTLIAALRDKDKNVLVTVMKALANIRDRRALDPILVLLTTDEPSVYRAALRSLEKLDPDWAETAAARKIVPALLVELEEGDVPTRKRILATFLHIKDTRTVTPLIEALNDANSNVRAMAAEALGRQGEPVAAEPLIAALEREESVARGSMARVLGRFGDRRAVEPIIVLLKDHRRSRRRGVSHDAILALGILEDSRAVDPLVEVLQSTADAGYMIPAIADAAHALGAIGDSRAAGALQAVIESHWSDRTRAAGIVARAAEEALSSLELDVSI